MSSLLDGIFSAIIVKGGVEYVQRKTLEFIGASVTIADDPVNERTQITIATGSSAPPHAPTHIAGGSDEVDADRLKLDFAPVNFTPQVVAGITTSANELSSYWKGIDNSLAALARITYATEPGTSHAFLLSDANKTILCTSSSPVALQLPTNATVAYPVGTVLAFIPMGTGQLTLSAAAGATIVSGGNEFKSARQFAPIFAQQTSANAWLVSGEKAA
jgi:hypothetical protein